MAKEKQIASQGKSAAEMTPAEKGLMDNHEQMKSKFAGYADFADTTFSQPSNPQPSSQKQEKPQQKPQSKQTLPVSNQAAAADDEDWNEVKTLKQAKDDKQAKKDVYKSAPKSRPTQKPLQNNNQPSKPQP